MVENEKYNRTIDNEENEKVLKDSEIIYLMDIYEREWEYRDTLLWKQTYRFFYFSLIMILLPSITSIIQIELPPINPKIFTCIGLVLAIISVFISFSYGIRLEASSDTYIKLMNKLPKSYRREKIDEVYKNKHRKMILKNPFNRNRSIFTMVQTKVLATLFFIAEIVMAIVILKHS